MVTSYSQLDKFLKCPYNWELKYIDGIQIGSKSKHLEYGLAVHETLEHVFKQIQSGIEINLAEAKQLFFENIANHEVPFDSIEEKKQWTAAGIEMIESLLEQRTDLEKLMMESQILGIELPFELPIKVVPFEVVNENTGEIETHDTIWVIGFIDLVLKTNEGIVLIDHKSGSKKFDKAKLRTDLQFPIYAMAIKHLFGEYPVKCYYNFTKIHEVQQVLVAEEVTADMEEVMNKRGAKEIYCISPKKAEKEVKQIFRKMARKKHPVNPTPLCYWCEYGYHLYGICLRSSKWCPSR